MSNQTQTSPACVPFFWPWAVGAEIAEGELKLAARNLKFLAESEKIDFGSHPQFATENRILLDLRTMRVRDFSSPGARGVSDPRRLRRTPATPRPPSTSIRIRA